MLDLLFIAILIVTALLAATVLVVPATSLALIVTACGILLTWRTARAQKALAERKLFLDLMPRRAEWYDRVKAALEGRIRERAEQNEAILNGDMPPPAEHLTKLWQLETEADWLFSTEMVFLMAAVILADKQLSEIQFHARDGDREAALEVSKYYSALIEEQSRLQDYLISYLYVGDIGKPKRSSVKITEVRQPGIKNWIGFMARKLNGK